MFEAIALDIDGTITYQNRQLDIQAIEAIRKAEENGLTVCLATGNILCYARTSSILLGTKGPLIAEDGGVVFDKETGDEYILGGVKEVDQAIDILEEKIGDIEHADSSMERLAGRVLERTFDAKRANDIFQKRGLEVIAVDSGFAIHIKDSDVNKGKALKKVASLIGCSVVDIAAGGDAENDVEMLQAAGWSFSPANADSKAKEASSFVAEGSYGAGVEEGIKMII